MNFEVFTFITTLFFIFGKLQTTITLLDNQILKECIKAFDKNIINQKKLNELMDSNSIPTFQPKSITPGIQIKEYLLHISAYNKPISGFYNDRISYDDVVKYIETFNKYDINQTGIFSANDIKAVFEKEFSSLQSKSYIEENLLILAKNGELNYAQILNEMQDSVVNHNMTV